MFRIVTALVLISAFYNSSADASIGGPSFNNHDRSPSKNEQELSPLSIPYIQCPRPAKFFQVDGKDYKLERVLPGGDIFYLLHESGWRKISLEEGVKVFQQRVKELDRALQPNGKVLDNERTYVFAYNGVAHQVVSYDDGRIFFFKKEEGKPVILSGGQALNLVRDAIEGHRETLGGSQDLLEQYDLLEDALQATVAEKDLYFWTMLTGLTVAAFLIIVIWTSSRRHKA